MLFRHQLFLNTGIVMFSLLVSYMLFFSTLEDIEELAEGETLVVQLEVDMLGLRRHEKDFMSRRDLLYVKRFERLLYDSQDNVEQSNRVLEKHGIDVFQLHQVPETLDRYHRLFQDVVVIHKQLGFKESEGLAGELKTASLSMEQALVQAEENSAQLTLLQLQRLEQRFLLYKQLDTLAEFEQRHRRFMAQLEGLSIGIEQQQTLLALAKRYRNRLIQYDEAIRDLGRSSELGLHGEMRAAVHETEELLAQAVKEIDQQLRVRIKSVRQLFYFIYIPLAVVALWLSWRINRHLLQQASHLL